jgi:tight adherence protein C
VSAAPALALLAGAVAAAGIVDAAGVIASRRRDRVTRGRRWPARAVASLARLGRRLGAPSPPRDLAGRIEAAGAPLGLGAGDVMAVKGAAGGIALVAGAPLAAALPGRLPLLAALAMPVAAFLGPDVLLGRRTRARGRAMELELPDLLDLLRVSVQAGMPLAGALGAVGARHHGVLAREWLKTAGELELGAPREQAMQGLVRRCPLPGMAVLVAALERSQRHGAPLSDTLAAQAREAREARARRLREQAAKAAPKIQLVVALLLVPSAMLLVAAALLSSLG